MKLKRAFLRMGQQAFLFAFTMFNETCLNGRLRGWKSHTSLDASTREGFYEKIEINCKQNKKRSENNKIMKLKKECFEVRTCFPFGFSTFPIHRSLLKKGFANFKIVSQTIDQLKTYLFVCSCQGFEKAFCCDSITSEFRFLLILE